MWPGIVFDAHTLLVATLAILVAAQLGSCAVLAKTFASGEGLLPRDNRLEKLSHVFTLERCLSGSRTADLRRPEHGGLESWQLGIERFRSAGLFFDDEVHDPRDRRRGFRRTSSRE